ncbi:peptidylprolyl isomerase [Aestuariivivens sediminis]|uniref:peptidylprolyl isomerase n=1 Tax=Aestuariivivens sediminis TaxID=2913557 RepID=UPI001F57AA8A|nr:peptidylprolyl isomerase [Aestuariivivens sediminis]
MRIALLLGLFFILLNCEDKQSKKNSISQPTMDLQQEEKTNTTVARNKPERVYPQLNDENAMEFFLQYEKDHKENKVRMTTDFGVIDILLFNETKFHRANFIFLTKQNYFNNTQFYRVIDNFMVQAGNSDDRKTARKRRKIGKYLLPKDTKRGFTHERGVISMPSSEIDNPHKLASPYEFFIVQQHGGAHYLDGDYTIFGRVINGMDVVDRIAAVDTDEADWPLKNIFIRKVEILE